MAGCQSGATAPQLGGDAPLQTDRPVYELQQNGTRAEISFTYQNSTGQAVYLANCNGDVRPALQKWENGEWVLAWSPIKQMCLGHPVTIPPGADFDYSFTMHAFHPGTNAAPRWQVADPEGIYRLVWHPTHDYDPDALTYGSVLPLKDRISNNFELSLP